MAQRTNFITISADFDSSSVGSLSVDPSGALPALPFLQIPLDPALLFSASGISYAVAKDASGSITGYAAVAASNIVQSHITDVVSGLYNGWSNGRAAANMVDVPFRFKDRSARVRFDTLNAARLVGHNSLGSHVALVAANAIQLKKPATATDVLSAAEVAAVEASVNAAVSLRLGQLLGLQAVQDAVLRALVATNGPVLHPGGGALPYDASLAGLNIMLHLKNMQIGVSFPGQASAQKLVLESLPLHLSVQRIPAPALEFRAGHLVAAGAAVGSEVSSWRSSANQTLPQVTAARVQAVSGYSGAPVLEVSNGYPGVRFAGTGARFQADVLAPFSASAGAALTLVWRFDDNNDYFTALQVLNASTSLSIRRGLTWYPEGSYGTAAGQRTTRTTTAVTSGWVVTTLALDALAGGADTAFRVFVNGEKRSAVAGAANAPGPVPAVAETLTGVVLGGQSGTTAMGRQLPGSIRDAFFHNERLGDEQVLLLHARLRQAYSDLP